MSFIAFAAIVTASCVRHIYIGSVVRTFPAEPVDTHITFLTVLRLTSTQTYLQLYFFHFRPFVQTLECGPSVGFPRSFSALPSLERSQVAPPQPSGFCFLIRILANIIITNKFCGWFASPRAACLHRFWTSDVAKLKNKLTNSPSNIEYRVIIGDW